MINTESTKGKKSLLPVRSDFVFKLIFGDQRNVDILAAFLKSVLDIPDGEYDRLTVVDPHLKMQYENDKYSILDVKVHTVSGNVIHVEIQIKAISELRSRTIFSQSKLVTEQMSSGEKYSIIKRVVTIVILYEDFFDDKTRYHRQFRYRTDDGFEFTDLVEINTLELQKIPPDTDDTDLWYWMKFIGTDKEEDMEMLAQRSPCLGKAVGVLKVLSADERNRMLYESREMARMDFESRYDEAMREGLEKGEVKGRAAERAKERAAFAQKLLKRNRPIDEIIEDTGLTREDVDKLKQEMCNRDV